MLLITLLKVLAMNISKTSFFTRDKAFYKTLFPMMLTIALQNIVAYSVNMADNLMLGTYGQTPNTP